MNDRGVRTKRTALTASDRPSRLTTTCTKRSLPIPTAVTDAVTCGVMSNTGVVSVTNNINTHTDDISSVQSRKKYNHKCGGNSKDTAPNITGTPNSLSSKLSRTVSSTPDQFVPNEESYFAAMGKYKKIISPGKMSPPTPPRKPLLKRLCLNQPLSNDDTCMETPYGPDSNALSTSSQSSDNKNVCSQQFKRQYQRRGALKKQGSSTDQCKSRGASPDSQNTFPPGKLSERQNSNDQSRSSTPECCLSSTSSLLLPAHNKTHLKKQSRSSDDASHEMFDILWKLRTEESRMQSSLVVGQKVDGQDASVTDKPWLKNSSTRMFVSPPRQNSLDSILPSREEQQMAISVESHSRGNSHHRLIRQKVCVEDEDSTENQALFALFQLSPSLLSTDSSPNDTVKGSIAKTRFVSRQKFIGKSNSLDREHDGKMQLLKVLSAKSASACSSPITTPEGLFPSLIHRLKSLSRGQKAKATNDDYGKGKL